MSVFQLRLKELREQNGYKSQQAFADAFNVAQSTVGGWESGAREPSYDTIKRLSDFFDVPIDYLLGASDVPYKINRGNDNQVYIHSNEPISILFSLYPVMTVEQFSQISGIPYDIADYLSVCKETLDSCVFINDESIKPTYSQLLNEISDEQWKAISVFFNIEYSELRKGNLPLFPDPDVQKKFDFPQDIGFAAYEKDGDFTIEELRKIKEYAEFVRYFRSGHTKDMIQK